MAGYEHHAAFVREVPPVSLSGRGSRVIVAGLLRALSLVGLLGLGLLLLGGLRR